MNALAVNFVVYLETSTADNACENHVQAIAVLGHCHCKLAYTLNGKKKGEQNVQFVKGIYMFEKMGSLERETLPTRQIAMSR